LITYYSKGHFKIFILLFQIS